MCCINRAWVVRIDACIVINLNLKVVLISRDQKVTKTHSSGINTHNLTFPPRLACVHLHVSIQVQSAAALFASHSG